VQTNPDSIITNPDIPKHQCFSSILPPTKLTPINNKIQIGKYKMQKRHVQQNISANNYPNATAGTMNLSAVFTS
jgi:hypothetical protein